VRIRSRRLLLRPFEPADVEDAWELLRLPEVARHMLRGTFDRAGAEAAVRQMAAETRLAEEGDYLTFAVVLPDTGRVIGEISLLLRSKANRGAEVGFEFHPGHHGRGLATEAVTELLDVGFAEFGLHRIFGRCSVRNTASARLMERLGMRREAHLLGTRWVKGEWRDEFHYAVLADEWRVRRSR
jgi:RimJ/RimL family protein N-acetyltransferase